MSNLPPETVDRIHAAQQRKASPDQLLGIVSSATQKATNIDITRSNSTAQISQSNVCPASSATVTGSVDSVTANISDRIAMLRQAYGDQWNILTGDGSTSLPRATSLPSLMTAFQQIEELARRIDDPEDRLSGLDRYTNVFTLNGAGMTLFHHVDDLLAEKNDRDYQLLSLLIRPENNDSFSRGSSYHFLAGIMLEYGDAAKAFSYEMMIHKFSACLVYIANAYIRAADILERKYAQLDNALALLAVDVPTPEYQEKYVLRHLKMADISYIKRDITNVVRHLQAVCVADTNYIDVVPRWFREYSGTERLWASLATNPWTRSDADAAIEQGIRSDRSTPNDILFLDALSHDWPAMADVPIAILTNRVLSNNIFPQRCRTLPQTGKIRPSLTNNLALNRTPP